MMSSIFRNFVTNRSLFFDLFDQAALNVVQMTALLECAVSPGTAANQEQALKQINKLAAGSDEIAHKINLWLNKIMFTPINKNDIHALTMGINDVADMVREAANRVYLYEVEDAMPAINEITAILSKSSLKIQQCVAGLRSAKDQNLIVDLCKQVKDDERASDKVYYHAVAALFSDEKDAIKLIKYREILSSLENAVNKCKCVSDILGSMMLSRI